MRNPYDCFPASDLRRVEFRHHGLGMLQGYLPGSKKARVHIWHPALCAADWRLEVSEAGVAWMLLAGPQARRQMRFGTPLRVLPPLPKRKA